MENEDDKNGNGQLILDSRIKTKKPSMYKVIMLNDDYTPMEFVVHVLKSYFRKSEEEATQVMLHVHQRGVGVCGVYTYEVAETKASQVMATFGYGSVASPPFSCYSVEVVIRS